MEADQSDVGSHAKIYGWPIKAGKGKEICSSLEPPK